MRGIAPAVALRHDVPVGFRRLPNSLVEQVICQEAVGLGVLRYFSLAVDLAVGKGTLLVFKRVTLDALREALSQVRS